MAKVNLTALKQTIQSGQTSLFVKALPGDNVYVTGGVALSIAPNAILDPNAIGLTGPDNPPAVNPGVFSQSMGGYTAAVVPTTIPAGTAGLAAYKLQYFAPGGAEIGAGAYNAAITAGTLILEIVYP